MTKTLPTLFLAAALASGATAAFAAKPSDPGVPVPPAGPDAAFCEAAFKRYDTNRDGKLSYAEYAEGRFGELRFAVAPSEREIRNFMATYTAQAKKADRNRDGFLTKPEHMVACQNSGP